MTKSRTYRLAALAAGLLCGAVSPDCRVWLCAGTESDGTVVLLGTGDGLNLNLEVPPGLTGVIAISTGDNFTLALTSAGTIVAWGNVTLGQTSVSNLAGVTSISVGFTSNAPMALSTTVAPATTVPVTIASTPSGLTFTVCTFTYTTPQTLNFAVGGACIVTFNSPQNGPAGTQYVFNGWGDGSTANPRTIVAPPAANSYMANLPRRRPGMRLTHLLRSR